MITIIFLNQIPSYKLTYRTLSTIVNDLKNRYKHGHCLILELFYGHKYRRTNYARLNC
jgi:hypothetical protein